MQGRQESWQEQADHQRVRAARGKVRPVKGEWKRGGRCEPAQGLPGLSRSDEWWVGMAGVGATPQGEGARQRGHRQAW